MTLKVDLSNMVIDQAFREHSPDKCAVACSFGKDSMVVLDLVRRKYPEILTVFCNTGVEFPETLALRDYVVLDWNLNYYEARPQGCSFWSCVERYGWPPLRFDGKHGSRQIKCCYLLKEKPAMDAYKTHNIELCFTGITAAESRNRLMLEKRCGEYYFAKTQDMWKCHPIMSWTEAEVWEYIRSNKIPYNSFYDKFPNQRVGCIPCTGHIGWEKKMAEAFPKMYRKVQKMRGQELID